MNKELIWHEDLIKQYQIVTESILSDFLELIQYIQDNKVTNIISGNLIENEELWNWIGSKDCIELVDLKRELSKKIQKAQVEDEETINELVKNIGSNMIRVICLCFQESSSYCAASLEGYYKALKLYLCKEKKSEFCQDMKECFPNLFFDSEICSSMNTLNRKFEELRVEIIQHLEALNNYRDNFIQLIGDNKPNREIADCFSGDTGIDCSPQSGREGNRNLKLKLYNSEKKMEQEVVCELHTKFKKFNIDRTKQDRIYFFPGNKDIENGKVVIKHIGKHL